MTRSEGGRKLMKKEFVLTNSCINITKHDSAKINWKLNRNVN